MEIIGFSNYTITEDGVVMSKRGLMKHKIDKDGYHQIGLWNGKQQWFYIHRLVYQHYGKDWDETLTVDHIDGNKSNNRIENLRMATRTEQNYNQLVRKTNKLGVKGVSKHGNKYRAKIRIDGKKVHLGYFDTAEEATNAFQTKARELHGEFYRS
jgi:hypothetical protein